MIYRMLNQQHRRHQLRILWKAEVSVQTEFVVTSLSRKQRLQTKQLWQMHKLSKRKTKPMHKSNQTKYLPQQTKPKSHPNNKRLKKQNHKEKTLQFQLFLRTLQSNPWRSFFTNLSSFSQIFLSSWVKASKYVSTMFTSLSSTKLWCTGSSSAMITTPAIAISYVSCNTRVLSIWLTRSQTGMASVCSLRSLGQEHRFHRCIRMESKVRRSKDTMKETASSMKLVSTWEISEMKQSWSRWLSWCRIRLRQWFRWRGWSNRT